MPRNIAEDDLSTEERIQLAVQAILASGSGPNGSRKLSIRQAAADFNVPKSTLSDRLSGKQTRAQAHEKEQTLSSAQEAILVTWAKVMGRRAVPITPAVLREYAADISGKHIGECWVQAFMKRHPDLKLRRTATLEACRANALNATLVREFYELVRDLVTEHNIPPENIYNMDEKGILMGIGKPVTALVDRDQRTLHHIVDGNRELVTVIEAVCADGTALPPSVIFQGKRRDLEWSRDNPCNASVSFSPNGWTDQELGYLWLKRDFEPITSQRNTSGHHRLLILDGHNSHCTYKFCKFADEHEIIVICLPSHTTHALQPCDVGVFGPLSSAWKAEVMVVSRDLNAIRKTNLLRHYHNARQRALKKSTIITAFARTGIWPWNPDAIDPELFAPATNTSTDASQPIPVQLPSHLIVPIPESSLSSASMTALPSQTPQITPVPSEASTPAVSAAHQHLSCSAVPDASLTLDAMPLSARPITLGQAVTRYFLANVPEELPRGAPRTAVLEQNVQLRGWIDLARAQLESNHAQMTLMELTNRRLQKKAFAKTKPKTKKIMDTTHARHMTGDEALDQLARRDWESAMKECFAEAATQFKVLRKAIDQHYRDLTEQEKQVLRALQAEEKARKKAEELALKEAERARKVQIRNEKALEAARAKESKAEERRAKQAAREAEKTQQAAEKAQKAAEREQARLQRQARAQKPKRSKPTSDSSTGSGSGSVQALGEAVEDIRLDQVPRNEPRRSTRRIPAAQR